MGANAGLPDVTLAFTYDALGKRTSLTDSTGTTAYAYDSVDRPLSVTNPKGEVYSTAYLDAQARVVLDRPGSRTDVSLDDAGFLSSIVHSSSGVTLSAFSYQLDPAGLRTGVSGPDGSRFLAYDANSHHTIGDRGMPLHPRGRPRAPEATGAMKKRIRGLEPS